MMQFDISDSEPSNCEHCGTHVSQDFRRTLGAENNVVHRCPACDSRTRLEEGTAAGKTVDHPDPADQPERNNGPRVSARTDGGVGQ